MDDVIVNFVPTGVVPRKTATPHVPVSPSEIVEQVHEAYETGITLVHVHARNADGTPTHRGETYREIFDGIRKHCPDLPICASLSGRVVAEFGQRTEVLELRPDMASLTLSSLNFSKGRASTARRRSVV